MTTTDYAMPKAPPGFEACRSMLRGGRGQITHLVALDSKGSNGGRPTACGLTRFDDFTPEGRPIPNTAGLPGWGLGGGVSGPGVEQIECGSCYSTAATARNEDEGDDER